MLSMSRGKMIRTIQYHLVLFYKLEKSLSIHGLEESYLNSSVILGIAVEMMV